MYYLKIQFINLEIMKVKIDRPIPTIINSVLLFRAPDIIHKRDVPPPNIQIILIPNLRIISINLSIIKYYNSIQF